MAKHKIDQAREERIEIEIVVDCYNESERYSAWIADFAVNGFQEPPCCHLLPLLFQRFS